MADIRTTTTNYVHPTDPNLLNIHKAMKFNAEGEPQVRVHVDGISLEGDVIVDTVSLSSSTLAALESINVQNTVTITGTVSVSNFPTTSTVYQGTNPWTITGTVAVSNPVTAVTATISGSVATTISGTNLDAFARIRMSNPVTMFDSALTGYRKYEFSSSTSTGGTVTFDYNANVRKMNVTTASGSEVIRESYKVFSYQPGKSLLVMSSFKMAPSQTNLRQRLGFFGAANGIYFEQVNGTKNWVIRSSSSGVLAEERKAQSTWNGDKLDGTGPSGLTLDLTATQIMWCDIEWLGVGSVRCGFIINGQFIVCHTFNHANNPDYTTTYMGSATLPMRFEITNTGATSQASTLQQICCTVISEGGYNPVKATYSAGTGITPKRLVTAGTYYPIVSLRLASGYLNSVVNLTQVDVLSPTVNYYRWAVLKNATLTGATWAGTNSTPRVNIDTAATAVTGGTEIQSGFASSREGVFLAGQEFADQLGRDLNDTSDTWTLVMTATGNNADVLAQIGWQEIA